MDRSPAYYISDLNNRHSDPHQTSNNNNGPYSSNSNYSLKSEVKSRVEEQAQMINSQIQESQSNASSGDYSSRLNNRYNPIQGQQQQQKAQNQIAQLAKSEHHQRNFVTNQMMNAQQSQAMKGSNSNSQSQYMVSNSNSHNSTNLTPHQFTQQGTNNNSPFPDQIHTANFLMNSNHHLYQANSQQQQQLQAHPRNSLFHHKTSSMDNDGKNDFQNQRLFHDNQHDAQMRRQNNMHNQMSLNEGASLTSSQSMTQGDFNRIRRKSDHQGFSSEVPHLDNLNLDVEDMLRGAQMDPQRNDSLSGQNKLLRSLVNTPNNTNNNDPNQVSGSGDAFKQIQGLGEDMMNMGLSSYDQDDDNIYEEIDPKMSRIHDICTIDSISSHSDTWKKNNKNNKKFLGASFTRWFSTRKKSSNSQNSDQEDNPYVESKSIETPKLITLPEPCPTNLTQEQQFRRLIVQRIVESENSYTNSLYRLINDYKRPLEEADPPILSANKIKIIFFRLTQILQIHKLFAIALSHQLQEWDQKQEIGQVFLYFSRPHILDIYADFINNFTNAMETARRAGKSKAFAQFIKDKSSSDKLGFFGSMVKPVQRFPQFIMFLSDLLKGTPFQHPDRMNLQKALTELESLADRLNERKREAERHFAVKQLLKDHLNESASQRQLLRQDDVCLLDMDPSTNTVLKTKTRKIYLLNDMLMCVSVSSNRLKFAVPLTDIIVGETITPAITNLLAHANLKNLSEPNQQSLASLTQGNTIERMQCEIQSLVHDLDLMMKISNLVSMLRFQYNGLNPIVPEQICMGIRDEIRKKEFQMTLIDRSCLQLRLQSKNFKDTLVIQFSAPESKRDWLVDVRLSKLALDRNNNPGWENVNEHPPPSHHGQICSIGERVPLFVKSLAIFKSDQSHLTCALHYYLRQAPFVGENPAGVLWICNVTIGASSLGALATNGSEISLIHSYELSDSHVTCLESVGSTLWIGLRQGRIIVIDANSPGEWNQFASLDVQEQVMCIKYFGHFVYVGLINGSVAVYDANNFDKPTIIELCKGSQVTCILPMNNDIFVCCSNKIWQIRETSIVDSFEIQKHTNELLSLNEGTRPNLMAHCGSGLWVSLMESPLVELYHSETLDHLVEIDVGKKIQQVLNDFDVKVMITSMMTTKGLLWIGTNVGMVATLTLPRLKGVPLVSGSINIALHRFIGPVNILINLSAGAECVPILPYSDKFTAEQQQQQQKNEEKEAIYDQYSELMNVGDYISSGRKSDSVGDPTMDTVVGWGDYNNPPLSNTNMSDDSVSNASSGAIYHDGLPRGLKRFPNQAVISNGANQLNMTAGPSNPIQQPQHMSMQNQMMTSKSMGMVAPDSTQSAQTAAMNGNMTQAGATSNLTGSENMNNDQQAQTQQQLQQQEHLISSESHSGGSKPSDQQPGGSQADYGSQSGRSKLYDQAPAQLIHHQQQQQIHQSRQALNQVDGGMIRNMQLAPTSIYGQFGHRSKSLLSQKTVLVLAGGNGYQRLIPGDNKLFPEHAHCIIWEYKT